MNEIIEKHENVYFLTTFLIKVFNKNICLKKCCIRQKKYKVKVMT